MNGISDNDGSDIERGDFETPTGLAGIGDLDCNRICLSALKLGRPVYNEGAVAAIERISTVAVSARALSRGPGFGVGRIARPRKRLTRKHQEQKNQNNRKFQVFINTPFECNMENLLDRLPPFR